MQNRHHIIVDGYNMILRGMGITAGNESRLEQARQKLVGQLSGYRVGKNIAITIVFDGQMQFQSMKSTASGVTVVFSRPPQKADHVIIELLEKEANAANATLVTSDMALASLARSIGSNHVTVEEFMGKYTAPERDTGYGEKYDPPQSRAEIEKWLKIFNEFP